MEIKGLLQSLWDLSTSSYTVRTTPIYFLKMHFNF
jgi:hypothetical protein